MSEPIWNKFLTARDKAVFAAGGFGARAGFGKTHPPIDQALAQLLRRGGLGGP